MVIGTRDPALQVDPVDTRMPEDGARHNKLDKMEVRIIIMYGIKSV